MKYTVEWHIGGGHRGGYGGDYFYLGAGRANPFWFGNCYVCTQAHYDANIHHAE